jgi:hypothetical protein
MTDFSLSEVPESKGELIRRQQVVEAEMNDALLERLRKIRDHMAKGIQDNLRRTWQLGRLVAEKSVMIHLTSGEIFIRNEKAIYRNEAHGFVKSIAEMPADKISPELIEKMEEDIQLTWRLEQTAIDVRRELEAALKLARERAAAQASIMAQSDDAERDHAQCDDEPVDVEFEEKKPAPRLEDKSQKAGQAQGNGPARKRGAQNPIGI